jgi:hypothetical protein
MPLVQSVLGGHSLVSNLLIPASEEIVAVTKKKMSYKNAMSAIDPAFTSGTSFECLINYIFKLINSQKQYHNNKTIRLVCVSFCAFPDTNI